MDDLSVKKKAEEFLHGQQLYYRAVKAQTDEVERFRQSRREHEQAIELLDELPSRTRHDIMVPIGTKAFMPGQLVHTNEVMILLGDNYFAERSASQAKGIIKRRIDVINDLIEKGEKSTKDLLARADLSEQARKAALQTLAPTGQNASSKPPAPKAPEKEEEDDEDDEDEEDEEDEEDDDDIGKDAEFWAAAGFTGAWGDEHADTDEDDEDENDNDEQAPHKPSTEASGEWDDSEPVFEIRETEEGVEGELVQHESQKAFENSKSYPY